MKINEWIKAAYANSVTHGWYEGVTKGDRSVIPEKLCLIHSELSEALEAFRDGDMGSVSSTGKPEGFSAEIADVVIRVFDLCGHLDISPDNHSIEGEFSRAFLSAKMVGERQKKLPIPAELCGIHCVVSNAYYTSEYASPETFNDEVFTIVWRCMVLCAIHGIDLEAAVLLKHEYNLTRPWRHNGKAC